MLDETYKRFLHNHPWLEATRGGVLQSDNASNYREPTYELDQVCCCRVWWVSVCGVVYVSCCIDAMLIAHCPFVATPTHGCCVCVCHS